MPWDITTREAVEASLEGAHWDDDKHTITLFNPDDDRIRETVRTRAKLENYLRRIASEAFHANVTFESGKPVFECDEYGVVEGALHPYEEQLNEFFPEE